MVDRESGPGPDSRASIRAVAALDDDLRRGMLTYIRDAGRPVTREDAAAAVGISRKLAAFHLDKLVDVGLLRAAYDEPAGSGRVGRTPKTYRPTDLDVRVSIPARRHEDLSDILVDALAAEPAGGTAMQSAMQVARRHGEALGAEERHRSRAGRLGAERALTLAERVLRERGFDPTRDEPLCVRLRNCPFHPLAAQAPQVVCGINHAFLTGFLGGLHARTVEAVLNPRPGACCVELQAGPASTDGTVPDGR